MSNQRRHTPAGQLLLLAAVIFPACGYSHEQLHSRDVYSVAVPIFKNRSFYRDLERDVTEALINEIELRTPYKVVSRDRADTLVKGEIIKVDQSRLSRSRDGGLPQKLEMRIRINFEWQDLRSGKTLRNRRGFEAVGRYVPAHPVGEPYQTAQRQAAQRLAREIVSVMGQAW